MSPLGTDVVRIVACPGGRVARCVSVADTSLSLSLSLSAPLEASRLAAGFPRSEQCSRGWVSRGPGSVLVGAFGALSYLSIEAFLGLSAFVSFSRGCLRVLSFCHLVIEGRLFPPYSRRRHNNVPAYT